MKKLSIPFLLIFLFCFCSCNSVTPFSEQTLPTKQPKIYKIYVCGAVQNEGYIELPEGSEWLDCVISAGYLYQTALPSIPYGVITSDGALALRYFDGEKYCDCTNLNGPLIAQRAQIENVSAQVVNKIADFIANNGKITDKTQLKPVLGELYSENYYKFFVSETDYEKVG